jgi:type IV secretion system protein VirD4
MTQPAKKHWSGTNAQELKELLRFERSQGMGVKLVLFLVAFYLGSTILAGALVGYVRAYNRFMRHKNKMPTFGNLPAIVKWAMFFGAVFSVVVQLALAYGGVMIYSLIFGHDKTALIIAAINGIFNLLFSIVVVIFFRRWQIGMNNIIVEKDKFGSARFAKAEELLPYSALSKRTDSDADTATGLSLGSYYRFWDKGHILTVAGTRGGKGTNLIIPNLLGVSDYRGSWVVTLSSSTRGICMVILLVPPVGSIRWIFWVTLPVRI